jgi:hypothetical protein
LNHRPFAYGAIECQREVNRPALALAEAKDEIPQFRPL